MLKCGFLRGQWFAHDFSHDICPSERRVDQEKFGFTFTLRIHSYVAVAEDSTAYATTCIEGGLRQSKPSIDRNNW